MVAQRTFTWVIVATIVATIAFLSGPRADAAGDRQVVIEIRSFEFATAAPALEPGDVVIWVNHDIVPHTATATDESWDSDLIEPGGAWRMVVEQGAHEAYFCRFHPAMTARLDIAET